VPCLVITHTRNSSSVEFTFGASAGSKTTNRKQLVGLKIGCARVQFIGCSADPRTGHVVLAGTQRRLVKPRASAATARFSSARGQNVVASSPRGAGNSDRQKGFLPSSARRRGVQFQPSQSPVASSACQAAIRSADTGTERRPVGVFRLPLIATDNRLNAQWPRSPHRTDPRRSRH
jgi:hypothetical protein